MTAYNVVRFKVKPGQEQEFLKLEQEMQVRPAGARKAAMIKTGDRTYCFIGEWDDMNSIVAARPEMIASLDKMRGLLEDLGGGLGVTDAVSGETVYEIK
jgi:quinol monooxygenase YgiN